MTCAFACEKEKHFCQHFALVNEECNLMGILADDFVQVSEKSELGYKVWSKVDVDRGNTILNAKPIMN